MDDGLGFVDRAPVERNRTAEVKRLRNDLGPEDPYSMHKAPLTRVLYGDLCRVAGAMDSLTNRIHSARMDLAEIEAEFKRRDEEATAIIGAMDGLSTDATLKPCVAEWIAAAKVAP